MKKLITYSTLLFLTACSCGEEKKQPEPAPQAPLTQDKNSLVFTKGFDLVIGNYYSLQMAFYNESILDIDSCAKNFLESVDNIPLKEFKGDSSIIENAKEYTNSMSNDIKGLLGEKDITEKRKAFEMATNNFITLIMTTQYSGNKIYKAHCANAVDNREAFWLAEKNEIKNPYTPKATPACGEVIDTFNYPR